MGGSQGRRGGGQRDRSETEQGEGQGVALVLPLVDLCVVEVLLAA